MLRKWSRYNSSTRWQEKPSLIQKPLGLYLSLVISTPKPFSFLSIHLPPYEMPVGRWNCRKKHVPSGYAFIIVEHEKDEVLSWRIKRERNCLEDFIKELERIARDVYNRKKCYRFLRNDPPVPKEFVNDCWIRIKPLENDQEEVLDHCDYSGNFLSWTHSQYNLKRKSINFTPVIALESRLWRSIIHVQYSTRVIRTISSLWFPQQMKTTILSQFPSGWTLLCTEMERPKIFMKTFDSWIISNSCHIPWRT